MSAEHCLVQSEVITRAEVKHSPCVHFEVTLHGPLKEKSRAISFKRGLGLGQRGGFPPTPSQGSPRLRSDDTVSSEAAILARDPILSHSATLRHLQEGAVFPVFTVPVALVSTAI